MSTEEFWEEFLGEEKLPPETKYIDAFYFDNSGESANRLLELVLAGKKRATSSSAISYEICGERPPQAGDYSIVTDWGGKPYCVIKTVSVTVLPFKDMTFEICQREGEDSCLESWRKNHISFFTEEGKEEGYVFNEDMKIIFEDFEVVYRRK